MAIKVGINGFGRIGRVALRIMEEQGDKFDIRAINLRKADLDQMVYQLKYDTIFGRFCGTVDKYDDGIVVNGKKIKVFAEDKAENIKWADAGAEYIIESTGVFLTKEKCAPHLEQGGAKKIIMSAPAKDDTPMFVYGVNSDTYTKDMQYISNASCTTNCLAPMAKVLQDNFGIEEGLMTTIHSSTSKQKTVDARDKDWRIGRAVYSNIIPSTTGAAKAVGKVIPSLKGKLTGMSVRVPSGDGSLVDLTCRLSNSTTYDEIVAAMEKAAEGELKGTLVVTHDPVVSQDVIGFSAPCLFDAKGGIALNDKFVKLLAWYDNEWGYTSALIRMLEHMYDVDNA